MNAPSSNRLIGVLVLLLFCYLALFAWNARTGYLDTIAERTGLEIVGYVLSPVVWVKDQCVEYWRRYVALIDVAEENERLRDDLRRAYNYANLVAEERAELNRLRKLLQLEPLRERPAFAARIIAWRFGPQAARNTFTINKGFLDGALVGMPVATDAGVVGRVLRSAPHTATVLMLTDSGFRLAVISQQSRTPGIIMGGAGQRPTLEMAYVAQNARISPGELLITSGLDGLFPKGIPVGIVTAVMPGNEILFQQVHAQPTVDMDRLEEVLVLQVPENGPPLLESLPDPAEIMPPPQPPESDAANGAATAQAPPGVSQ